jgi:hypothetical protein
MTLSMIALKARGFSRAVPSWFGKARPSEAAEKFTNLSFTVEERLFRAA